MGSGKSTVASELAHALALPCIDLDDYIAQQSGRSIRELFMQGERAFRRTEAKLLQGLLESHEPAVVALGGGTVTHRPTRHVMLRLGLLVTLSAPAELLADRVGEREHRPLLDDVDPVTELAQIIAARQDAYAECHATLDVSSASVSELVAQIRALLNAPPVVVPLGMRSYRVEIGSGQRHRLPGLLQAHWGGQQMLVVSDRKVAQHWLSEVDELCAEGRTVAALRLPSGEQHKRLRSVKTIWDAAFAADLDRSALMLGLGGGVVGDMTAFAASTFYRGVALGQLPTSLLAMVDSSVGGKTGVDRPEGKNLIGSFYQPRFVLCDLDFLQTLPVEELRAGMAEVIKAAWLAGPEAVDRLAQRLPACMAGDMEVLGQVVREAVQLKSHIVTQDEFEGGCRRLLNFGHTLGHAIEAAHDYRVRHGEAVALGMIAACRIAEVQGDMHADDTAQLVALLEACALPTDLHAYLDERALSFLQQDKKRDAQHLHFVMPAQPGQTTVQKIPVTQVQALTRKLLAMDFT